MTGLELVSEQLEAFSKPIDFSKHNQQMQEVDVELASIRYRCVSLVQIKDYITSIDGICTSLIFRGRCAPEQGILDAFEKAVPMLGSVASNVIQEGMPYISQGYRIEQFGRLREIAENPGAGLQITEIRSIIAESLLPNGNVKEVDFPESTFEKLREIGKLHPVADDDDD